MIDGVTSTNNNRYSNNVAGVETETDSQRTSVFLPENFDYLKHKIQEEFIHFKCNLTHKDKKQGKVEKMQIVKNKTPRAFKNKEYPVWYQGFIKHKTKNFDICILNGNVTIGDVNNIADLSIQAEKPFYTNTFTISKNALKRANKLTLEIENISDLSVDKKTNPKFEDGYILINSVKVKTLQVKDNDKKLKVQIDKNVLMLKAGEPSTIEIYCPERHTGKHEFDVKDNIKISNIKLNVK